MVGLLFLDFEVHSSSSIAVELYYTAELNLGQTHTDI